MNELAVVGENCRNPTLKNVVTCCRQEHVGVLITVLPEITVTWLVAE